MRHEFSPKKWGHQASNGALCPRLGCQLEPQKENFHLGVPGWPISIARSRPVLNQRATNESRFFFSGLERNVGVVGHTIV